MSTHTQLTDKEYLQKASYQYHNLMVKSMSLNIRYKPRIPIITATFNITQKILTSTAKLEKEIKYVRI